MGSIKHVYTSPQADVGDPTLVQPSDWNSAHIYSIQDAISLGGNTAGLLADISTGRAIFAGGNNITLSQDGNSVTFSGPNTAAQSVQTQNLVDVTLGGNTAGVLALISSGTLFLAGGNNVTLSQNAQSVTISGAAQSVQTQNLIAVSLSAGNTSGVLALISSGTMRLAGGNNITLSQNGQSVTISGPNTAAQSVQTQNLIDVTLGGNTAGVLALISSGTMFLAGGNNITLSQNAQSVTISGAAQSVQTQNLVAVSLSAGNTAGVLALISSGTFRLAGGNNITLSQDGQSVTISGPNTAAQSVQTQNFIAASLGGNTAGVLALLSSGTMLLAGGDNITLSQNGQSVTISGPAAGAGILATTVKSVLSANSVGTVTRYAAEDHGHAGLNSISVGGNTVGATSAGAGSLIIAGGNNITLSGATAAGGMTLSISGPAAGGGNFAAGVSSGGNTVGTTGTIGSQLVLVGGSNITLSQSIDGASATVTINQNLPPSAFYYVENGQVTITRDLSQFVSTIFVMPINVPDQFVLSRVLFLNSMQTSVSSAVTNTTYGVNFSRGVALYYYNGTSLSRLTSMSRVDSWSYTSNNSTISYDGARLHSLPLEATLTAGNYWVAFSWSTSASRSGTNTVATTIANSYFAIANPFIVSIRGLWSSGSDTNWRSIPFTGYYSIASNAFPAQIGSGDITTGATVGLWCRLDRGILG